ncbi:MAG: hypothetical protein HY741_18290 [Chloroflexi bacterium]|nr:hypothetical protein [Chloroflexota bacterium]
MKKKQNKRNPLPKDAVVVFRESPERDDPNDMLAPEYDLDFSQARPNRFAGKIKYTHGGARKGAGRKRGKELLIDKHIYLTPRHIKRLQKIDANLSVAIRQVVDAYQR